jgi:hypothetical protein
MPAIEETANLSAGTKVPFAGIYLVSHYDPPHASPHEVLISVLEILPECTTCAGVRFSLRSRKTEPIEDNEFFRYLGQNANT